MINAFLVLEKLRQLTEISDEKAAELLPLCTLTALEISEKLKSMEYAKDSRILMLCAAVSHYRHLLIKGSQENEISSFKAGDVSMKKSFPELLRIAENLKNEAFWAACPLLKDADFIFRQVGS